MKTLMVKVPDATKAKLNEKRKQGYTIAGFVRQALAEALVDVKIPPRRRAA